MASIPMAKGLGIVFLGVVTAVANAEGKFHQAQYLSATVWAPNDDIIFTQVSNGTSVTWSLSDDVEDGIYKYEVLVSNVAAESRSRSRDDADAGRDDAATGAIAPHVMSGGSSFLIRNGSVVTLSEDASSEEGEPEGASSVYFQHGFVRPRENAVDFVVPEKYTTGDIAMLDIVQDDEVTVKGSQCIGDDCLEDEIYGSDTLRLKENTLRIHFHDTSSLESFPSQDWRVAINDANEGGANFFGIENADVNRRVLTLLDDGQRSHLGVGTSNPTEDIEIENSNIPTLRLRQNGAEGHTPQVWDVKGHEGQFYIQDSSHTRAFPGGGAFHHPFAIKAKAPHNSFWIHESGYVSLGIENAAERLHVGGNALLDGNLICRNLEVGGRLDSKTGIENLNLTQALGALNALEPVQYAYSDSPGNIALGFIAENVPELVATPTREGVDPLAIATILTKVVQEQQQLIEALTERLDNLTDVLRSVV